MEEIQQQLDAFYKYWRKIEMLYDSYARSIGISATSLEVLYYIYKGNDTCTQTAICEWTLLPKQTVHSAIQAFVKDGTILLSENPENRKSKYLVLSEDGRRFCRQIFKKLDRCEYEAMAQFPEAKREALIALLAEYVNAFETALNKE